MTIQQVLVHAVICLEEVWRARISAPAFYVFEEDYTNIHLIRCPGPYL